MTRLPAVTHSADLRDKFRIGGGDDRIRRVNTEATEVLKGEAKDLYDKMGVGSG